MLLNVFRATRNSSAGWDSSVDVIGSAPRMRPTCYRDRRREADNRTALTRIFLLLITYSVFRLAALRTDRSVRDSVSGIRAGERKTCCAKPLPRPPGLWGLNAVPPFADAQSGRSAGQLAGFGCTKRAFER